MNISKPVYKDKQARSVASIQYSIVAQGPVDSEDKNQGRMVITVDKAWMWIVITSMAVNCGGRASKGRQGNGPLIQRRLRLSPVRQDISTRTSGIHALQARGIVTQIRY